MNGQRKKERIHSLDIIVYSLIIMKIQYTEQQYNDLENVRFVHNRFSALLKKDKKELEICAFFFFFSVPTTCRSSSWPAFVQNSSFDRGRVFYEMSIQSNTKPPKRFDVHTCSGRRSSCCREFVKNHLIVT